MKDSLPCVFKTLFDRYFIVTEEVHGSFLYYYILIPFVTYFTGVPQLGIMTTFDMK